MLCFFLFAAQQIPTVMPVPYTVTLYASKPSEVRLHIVLRYLMCLQKPDNPVPEYTSYVFDVTGSTWPQYVKKMILLLNLSNQKDDLLLQFWSFVLKNDGIDDITKKQMWSISPLLVHNQALCQAFPDLVQDWTFAYSLLSRKNPQALLDILNERKNLDNIFIPNICMSFIKPILNILRGKTARVLFEHSYKKTVNLPFTSLIFQRF